MSGMKHSPLPWSLEVETEDGDGMTITIPEIERCLHDWEWADSADWDRDLANAELITDAVHAYHANQQLITRLTEALRLVLLERVEMNGRCDHQPDISDDCFQCQARRLITEASTAAAVAKERAS